MDIDKNDAVALTWRIPRNQEGCSSLIIADIPGNMRYKVVQSHDGNVSAYLVEIREETDTIEEREAKLFEQIYPYSSWYEIAEKSGKPHGIGQLYGYGNFFDAMLACDGHREGKKFSWLP